MFASLKWTILVTLLLIVAVFAFSPQARSASYLLSEQLFNQIFDSTNKSIRITVDAENLTGNAAIGGTLAVTGATALNGGLAMDSTAFTVANTTGNVATTGTLTAAGVTALNGGLTMDSTAFTVANTSGNTSIAGTLGVAGVTSFSNYADLYVGVAATQSYSIASAGKANVIESTYSATGASSLHLMTDLLVSGRVVEIIDAGGNSDPNTITLTTQGAEKINGGDTYAIATDYKHVRCLSNGTHWFCD